MGGQSYASLGPEQKARAIARGKLNLAVYHGRVKRQPCEASTESGEVCGAQPAEAHHEDYSKPLEVEWLCPTHHRERERVKRATIQREELGRCASTSAMPASQRP